MPAAKFNTSETPALASTTLTPFAAFASPTVFQPLAKPLNHPTSLCVFANAKRSSSNQKRASKNKRVAAKKKTTTEKPPPPSQPKTSSASADEDLQREKASGASGDATPHRATAEPSFRQLENPEQDPLDAPTEPLTPLPQLTREEISALRFDVKSTPDEVIEYFADARRSKDFEAIVVANRDFVTENVLYRFTSAILQVDTRDKNIETREEEARNMRQLRKELIAHCWSYDFLLKLGVQKAEARLLNVLKGGNIKSDVDRYCGRTTMDVDSFWIVVFAAVAAWEERGRENEELANVDMQKSLAVAADACKTLPSVNRYLSPSLKAVQNILTSTDPDVQTNVVAELDDETIAQLCTFTEQVRLLPTPAYGALVRRLRSIRDYIRADRYGIEPTYLEPFRFVPAEVRRESRLVSFTKAGNALKQNQV